MLSRVAENLYWITRYLERAEDTARLINVHSHLMLDLPRKSRALGWQSLITISGNEAQFNERYRSANETNVVNFLMSDNDSQSSIITALRMARENMRTSRDIIPREAWEEVNNTYLATKKRWTEGVTRRTRYDFLNTIIRQIQQTTGILHGTMSHDVAYNFMRIGCYLERADMTSRIVDVRSANLLQQMQDVDLSPLENIQWMSVLKSLTAYQMYRQHVRLRVQGPDVLNFLLCDEHFPRSYYYCLDSIGYCLQRLPNNRMAIRHLRKLQQRIKAAQVHELAQHGLHEFIDGLQIGLNTLHDKIHTLYFNIGAETQT